ncbi:hypothetical protein J4454_02785 [Candidatus Pacearchaeota archaeon]|nr:hypothetical protein [Candidatus Pacearchaeota archaeon]HIH33765.1 hypothetical protein [Nanoarchaeota archaeon]
MEKQEIEQIEQESGTQEQDMNVMNEDAESEMPVEHMKDLKDLKEQKHPHAEKLSIEIVEKKENPLLDRVEITARVHAEKTPSKEQVKEALVSALKASAEDVILKNVLSSFGSHEFKIIAYLYKNKETMQKLAIKKKSKDGSEQGAQGSE